MAESILTAASRALEDALPDSTEMAQSGLYPDDLRAGVRAVLTAIREPSERTAEVAFSNGACGGHVDCWRAMIDALLAEEG